MNCDQQLSKMWPQNKYNFTLEQQAEVLVLQTFKDQAVLLLIILGMFVICVFQYFINRMNHDMEQVEQEPVPVPPGITVNIYASEEQLKSLLIKAHGTGKFNFYQSKNVVHKDDKRVPQSGIVCTDTKPDASQIVRVSTKQGIITTEQASQRVPENAVNISSDTCLTELDKEEYEVKQNCSLKPVDSKTIIKKRLSKPNVKENFARSELLNMID